MSQQVVNSPEASSSSTTGDPSASASQQSLEASWIPIDDSLGIWNEFRQTMSIPVNNLDEQPRQESSPLQNRPEFDNSNTQIMTPIMSSSLDELDELVDTKQPKPQEESSLASQSMLSTAEPITLRRTSSGRLWTGIRAANKGNSIEAVEAIISDQADGMSSSQLTYDELNEILGPLHQVPQQDTQEEVAAGDEVDSQPSRNNNYLPKMMLSPIQEQPQEVYPVYDDSTKNDTHHQALASSLARSVSFTLDPFQRLLSELVSFDFLFGNSNGTSSDLSNQESQEQDEMPRETMGLRNNVNSEIALGLEEQSCDSRVVISSRALKESSFFGRLGYAPGMQVVKVNGHDASGMSLYQVYSQMRIQIQVTDGRLSRDAIVTVHHHQLDLYVCLQQEKMYITKVEPNSVLEQAGFRPGMRVTKVNGKPCPSTFMELANLLTADVVAIPQEIDVRVKRQISNLSLPGFVEDQEEEEEALTQEEEMIHHNGSNQCHPSSSPLSDLLQGGGNGGLKMITA